MIQKIVLNFNQNWLDIRMGSKFWYLENQTEADPYRNILGIRIYPNQIYILKYINYF